MFRNPINAVHIHANDLANLMLPYTGQSELHDHDVAQQVLDRLRLPLLRFWHLIAPAFGSFVGPKAPY
jgi:hypothetical protein